MRAQKRFGAVAAFLFVLAAAGCSDHPTENRAPSDVTSHWNSTSKTLTYAGSNGRTAGDLLLDAADADAHVLGRGAQMYVVGIHGVEASARRHQYWALSIDGQLAKVGAGSARTRDGQTITWELETY